MSLSDQNHSSASETTQDNNQAADAADYHANTFDDMNLPEDLLRGIYSYGFEKPSIIQQKAILPAMQRRDMIAQAQSGSGKTATFTIGALANLDLKNRGLQTLILAPTRELAEQIHIVAMSLSTYMNVSIHACYGGKAVRDDIRILRKGVQVVVGTPGRLLDMIQKRHLNMNGVRQLIIDEADEMLSVGSAGSKTKYMTSFSTCPTLPRFASSLPQCRLKYWNFRLAFYAIPFKSLLRTKTSR